jgi:hypothetical protein
MEVKLQALGGLQHPPCKCETRPPVSQVG